VAGAGEVTLYSAASGVQEMGTKIWSKGTAFYSVTQCVDLAGDVI